MSFAAPWALALAAAAAAGVVLLHFLARRRRTAPLPTTRFIPEAPATATTRAARPTDLVLLALRVLALLLIGAAFAEPVWRPERRPLARVVLLDASRAVANPAAARDSAAARLEPGDVLVVFDSVARVLSGELADSLPAGAGSPTPGSLSAALLAAYRAAATLHERADSVELVLVSPLVVEQWDSATARIRSLWPGGIRLARVGAAGVPATAAGGAVEFVGAPDDPLRATLALLGPVPGRDGAAVRLQRGAPTAEDLAWAREAGHVLVSWPDRQGTGNGNGGRGAVVAGDVVVVAPFEGGGVPGPGRVVAHWVDGAPAATERAEGAGCIRDVAIPIPLEGDLALRESTRRLLGALLAPCGAGARLEPLDAERVALLASEGGAVHPARPARAAVAPPGLVPALLAAAFAVLVLEMLLRRRRRAE